MASSRILWRLYATYAALVLFTSALTGVLVDRRLRASLERRIEEALAAKLCLAEYAAERAFSGAEGDPQGAILRLGRASGLRITLVRPDGTVLADSEEDPSRMESHAGRPEVAAALAEPGSTGTSRRHSRTVDDDLLYAARTVGEGRQGPLGVVRVAIPLASVETQLGEVRRTILAGTALGGLAALALGIVVARRFTRPLAAMTRVAQALREGRYDERTRDLPGDEIGELGRSLNELGVTLRAQIETISREEAQGKAILSGMVEGVVALDEQDGILFLNRAAAGLLGVEAGTAAGRKLWEAAREAPLNDLVAEARRAQGSLRREILLRSGPGERQIEVQAAPFEGGGRRGLLLVFHDITELRRLERVRRDFVANVSHELKTPLTSIKGYVETLQGGALEDPANNRRFLGKISTHVERLAALVRDLLSLARIEAQEERGGLPLSDVDWAPLVREAAARHEPAARAKGIALSIDAPAGSAARGDPEAMTQILDNLLDNAIKYTPAGGRVSVRTRREGSRLHLEVADTGIGIPPEDLERVFERFYRVDKARSRDAGGTGLGLSIVKHLAGTLGGTVSVESELGKGSKFTVSLPASSS